MKILLPLLLLSTQVLSQPLEFNKHFVQSEDKWVAFSPKEDGVHTFGFIYIDAQAGLTLQHEGSFTIGPSGNYNVSRVDSTKMNMKVRLQANQVKVAWISESKFKELNIPVTPEWLHIYKGDTSSVARLHKWGFMYNGWGECAKALDYLERAQKINPDFEGLGVELAYSYNCLEQYDKAISVLQNALKAKPTDAYTNKELIYALMKSDQLDKAAAACKNALAVCTDTQFNMENCYNLLHSFFLKKDKTQFNAWKAETRKWCKDNERLLRSITAMEAELGKVD